jgi:uncharacterized protein YbjT (DUF2867 family)
MSQFLILGGTGKVGSRIAQILLSNGHTVRVVSRRSALRFDWHDESTWAPSLDGSSGVFIVGPGSASDWSPLLSRFLDMAAAAGVERAVLLSARGVEFLPDGAVARAEAALQRGHVPWVILRPTHFAQNFTEAMFVPMGGAVRAPVGNGRQPFIDVQDIAEVAVAALTSGAFDRRILELSGPDAISFDHAAEVLSRVSQSHVHFEDQTDDAHVAELRASGTPEGYVEWRMAMLGGIRSGHDAYVSGDHIQEVLGRPATSFETWARREVPSAEWATAKNDPPA